MSGQLQGVLAGAVAAVIALSGAVSPGISHPGEREVQEQDPGVEDVEDVEEIADIVVTVANVGGALGVTASAGLATAYDTAVADVRPRGSWQWPLPGQPEVVKAFDPPDRPWLPGHRGIDLAGTQAAPVLAVDDGTVSYSGRIAGIGIVSVTHPNGIRSTYQPVTDRIAEGRDVRAGDQIGHLGDIGSHCLVRLCLHLGAVRGERTYLDPLQFLQPRELTLLPHGD